MTIQAIRFKSITSQEAKEIKAAFKKEFGIPANAKCNKKGSMKGTMYFSVADLDTSDTRKADTAKYSAFLAARGYIASCMCKDMLSLVNDPEMAITGWNWTTATVYKLAAK